PASAVPLPDGRVLVADAGHDEVVELAGPDGPVLRRTGGFREPNGVCLLPPEVAQEVGYDAVVADTVAHRLAGLGLADGAVRTLAGDGTQWMQGDGTERLSSPWDVVWWRDRVWVAMAGIHQLWTVDPRTGEVAVAAGTTNEGLLDGPLADAWFAQTSGLAVSADGTRLWLADSETSSLRWVEEVDGALVVRTAVGTGLFDFGFRDGPGGSAEGAGLLQHPLGVTALPDGSVAVADTYNGAVRRFDPSAGPHGELTTLATGLAEPSAAYVAGDALVVVESTAHRLTVVPLGAAVTTDGFAHRTQRPVTEVGERLELVVPFAPPPGQKVDERFGPATQLLVTATPPSLIRDGDGRAVPLTRTLALDPVVGEGVLHVAARAASCDAADDGEVPVGAACHLHQQDWGVPVRVVADGPAELRLPLGGEA
ncbi:MAG TPA: NHL repeat-containing protein, partial [Nocardioides sp.]